MVHRLVMQSHLSLFQLCLLKCFRRNSVREANVWALLISYSVIEPCHPDVVHIGPHSELC